MMRLKELEQYNTIVIQCHDNPDADAIASGYGLYLYFQSRNKQVGLIYSGSLRMQKPNLKLMVEKLQIPLTFHADLALPADALLITVDCQYGAGNVRKLRASHIAVIDHHQEGAVQNPYTEIDVNVGSCATLVWSLLKKENFPINDHINLGTALFYGLYSDTNQLSEIYHPLDMDMRDDLLYDRKMIKLFLNSNLTLKELEIAGIALIRYIFNDDFGYAIINAQPCDPNILGVISDFLLQVDGIYTCVVYNRQQDGYKLSVRSCIKEVKASELAEYLCADIGSGGGRYEKAGGVISLSLYEAKYPALHTEAYFGERMNAYFKEFDIIEAQTYELDKQGMKRYQKKKIHYGVVKTTEVFRAGTPVLVRTARGDCEFTISSNLYLLIGISGDTILLEKQEFEQVYRIIAEEFTPDALYQPIMKNKLAHVAKEILPFAKACVTVLEEEIYAKPLEKSVKIFTVQEEDNYMCGRPGDYIAYSVLNEHDVFTVSKELFSHDYEESECAINDFQ